MKIPTGKSRRKCVCGGDWRERGREGWRGRGEGGRVGGDWRERGREGGRDGGGGGREEEWGGLEGEGGREGGRDGGGGGREEELGDGEQDWRESRREGEGGRVGRAKEEEER